MIDENKIISLPYAIIGDFIDCFIDFMNEEYYVLPSPETIAKSINLLNEVYKEDVKGFLPSLITDDSYGNMRIRYGNNKCGFVIVIGENKNYIYSHISNPHIKYKNTDPKIIVDLINNIREKNNGRTFS